MKEIIRICLLASEEDFFKYLTLKALEQRADQATKNISAQATEIAEKYHYGKPKGLLMPA